MLIISKSTIRNYQWMIHICTYVLYMFRKGGALNSGGSKEGHAPPLNLDWRCCFFISSFISECFKISLRYHERRSKTLEPLAPAVMDFTLWAWDVQSVHRIFLSVLKSWIRPWLNISTWIYLQYCNACMLQ